MSEFSNKISITIPGPNSDNHKKKIQAMLMDIGGKWYIIKVRTKPIPLNKPRVSKKKNDIKATLTKANVNWN